MNSIYRAKYIFNVLHINWYVYLQKVQPSNEDFTLTNANIFFSFLFFFNWYCIEITNLERLQISSDNCLISWQVKRGWKPSKPRTLKIKKKKIFGLFRQVPPIMSINPRACTARNFQYFSHQHSHQQNPYFYNLYSHSPNRGINFVALNKARNSKWVIFF